MSSSAWKDLERRVCRALGAERRPSVGTGGWARGSDDDGTAPFSVEVKRTKRLQLRGAWVEQARTNGARDGRPWLLAIGVHRSPRVVAVVDFETLVALAYKAGIIRKPDEGSSMSTELPDPPEAPDEPAPAEPEPEPDDESDEG